MRNKKKSIDITLGVGARAVGHGLTAIIKIPADGIVKGANLIAPKPRSDKEKAEEKSLVSISKKMMETKTLGQGVMGLGKGIVKGVTGVVTDPIKGAKSSGLKGFVKGVGSGVVGVVARPVQGVSEFLESVDQTIDGKNRPKPINYFSSSLRKQVLLSKQGNIPNIMFECMTQLQMRGMDKEGIFRKPGNHTKIQETAKLLKSGQKVCFLDLDVLVIGSIFKLWLRELPQPLIPFRHYTKLIALGKTFPQLTEEEIMKWKINIRGIIKSINPPHSDCLSVLILFLSQVVRNSEVNKMDSYNLATVLAPNILYRKIDENAVQSREIALQTSEEMGFAKHIVKTLIEEVEFFFFGEEEEVQMVTASKTEEEKKECVGVVQSKPIVAFSTVDVSTTILERSEVKSVPSDFLVENKTEISRSAAV